MKKREGRLRSIFMLARKSQTLLYGSFTFHRNPECLRIGAELLMINVSWLIRRHKFVHRERYKKTIASDRDEKNTRKKRRIDGEMLSSKLVNH